MEIKETFKDLLKNFNDISQTVGAATSIISFLRDAKPAADLVINNVAPDIAARIRRNMQQTAEGHGDEVNFIKTLNLLDDVAKHPTRPLKSNMESFVEWGNEHHPVETIIFIFVAGLGMDDQERLNFLTDIATIRDAQRNGRTNEAHQLRFDKLQQYEAFTRPIRRMKKYFDANPHIWEGTKKMPEKIMETVKNIMQLVNQ